MILLVMNIIGISIAILMIVAVVSLLWYGKWIEVFHFFGVSYFGGKLLLGFLEFLWMPFAFASVKLAKANRRNLYILSSLLHSLLQASGMAVYCASCMFYFFGIKGPPLGLMLILGSCSASVPFVWAAAQHEEPHPVIIYAVAACGGSMLAAAILMFNGSLKIALIPFGALFLASAIYRVYYNVLVDFSTLRESAEIS